MVAERGVTGHAARARLDGPLEQIAPLRRLQALGALCLGLEQPQRDLASERRAEGPPEADWLLVVSGAAQLGPVAVVAPCETAAPQTSRRLAEAGAGQRCVQFVAHRSGSAHGATSGCRMWRRVNGRLVTRACQ